ncbi:MAG: ribosome hibernation-promoting factor, HPF/YfiA family [Candidatus Aquicultorales bacterium]
MEVIVKGRHVEITDALKKYAEDKVSRLSRYFDKINQIEVELMVERNPSLPNPQTAEVTLITKGPLIRAKVATDNMYASIDGVTDKLERQIKKFKGKLYSSHKISPGLGEFSLEHAPGGTSENGAVEAEEHQVVRVKRISLKPMTTDEATLQMELLGHDFFIFINSETDEVNVVYKRRDKNYGLIEPVFGKG